MRKFMGLALFFVVGAVSAQEADLPVQCEDRSFIARAICSQPEIKVAVKAANVNYMTSLSNTRSYAEWAALEDAKLRWSYNYSYCITKTDVALATDCLTSALAELSVKVPAAVNPLPYPERHDAAITASKAVVNQIIEASLACVADRIKVLDDGASPARDIATAAAMTCKPVIANQGRVRSNYYSPSLFSSSASWQSQARLTNQLQSPDNYIELVLAARAAKRQQLKSPPGKKSRKTEV